MNIKNTMANNRIVHYHDVYPTGDWFLKLYSVSSNKARADFEFIECQMPEIKKWLAAIPESKEVSHKIAVLILHYWQAGIYAWLVWRDRYNMTRMEVYFSENKPPFFQFTVYPDKSMIDYIQEFAIVYFENMEWEKYITKKETGLGPSHYLKTQFNIPYGI